MLLCACVEVNSNKHAIGFHGHIIKLKFERGEKKIEWVGTDIDENIVDSFDIHKIDCCYSWDCTE